MKATLNIFNNILSKFQCGFRKGYVMQSCLLMVLEFFKDDTDKNKAFKALLTGAPKAFGCFCYDC